MTDLHATFTNEAAVTITQAQSDKGIWIETVLVVLLTAAAVSFVSFLAIVTGLA